MTTSYFSREQELKKKKNYRHHFPKKCFNTKNKHERSHFGIKKSLSKYGSEQLSPLNKQKSFNYSTNECIQTQDHEFYQTLPVPPQGSQSHRTPALSQAITGTGCSCTSRGWRLPDVGAMQAGRGQAAHTTPTPSGPRDPCPHETAPKSVEPQVLQGT